MNSLLTTHKSMFYNEQIPNCNNSSVIIDKKYFKKS